MHTIETIKVFAEGYAHAHPTGDLSGLDDWVTWGRYDLNLTGADYAPDLKPHELSVSVYPAGWANNLPDPISTFIVQGA